MDNHLHQVAGLSNLTRSALEELLGRSLTNDEQVYIVALNPAIEKPTEVRREAWQRLETFLGAVRAQGEHVDTSALDVEKLIDDTCEQVRYGDKPCA